MRAALSAVLRPAWLATYAVATALLATQILTPPSPRRSPRTTLTNGT